MRLFPAVFANVVLVVSALGYGGLLRRLFPRKLFNSRPSRPDFAGRTRAPRNDSVLHRASLVYPVGHPPGLARRGPVEY